MFGFKSFGDKTELIFDRERVGVVGPNGCGKSNIVDAIRWVMGEQSAKGLRGSEMQDVIFNGTATRKRANFSEVSLTFINNQGLAPAPYHECAEIMITRRLYRSGESEYLINNVAVRLKDINDLFLGTGSSARAYSIVAQGKIDQIVLAKPEERRFLLEEAAGVAKYKVRKQAAERKMESTRTNLERIQDIVQELERSARHLERQVEKAEQFRGIQVQLRRLDEQVVSAKIARLDRLSEQNDRSRTEARQIFESASTDLSRLESEIEKDRLEALHHEKVSASEYDQLIQIKERFAQLDKETELRKQRILTLKNQIEERRRDVERLQSKTEANRDVVAQLLSEKESVLAQHEEQELEVEQLKLTVASAQGELAQIEQEVQVARQDLDVKKEAQIREQHRRDALQKEVDQLNQRVDQGSAQVNEWKARQSENHQKVFATNVQLEEIEARRMHAESQLAAVEAEEQSLRTESQEIQTRTTEVRETLARTEAELHSLQTLESHEVGYTRGSLERKKRTSQSYVLDLVRFRPDCQAVAEGFFEEFGLSFWSESINDEDLKDPRWIRVFGQSSVNHAVSLLSCVEGDVPEGLKPLLSAIEVVESLSDEAVSHTRIDRTGRIRLPLAHGIYRENVGVLQRQETPFGRKMEREELDAQNLVSRQTLSSLEERLVEIQSLLQGCAQKREMMKQDIRELSREIQTLENQKSQTLSQIETWENRLQEKAVEIEELGLKATARMQELSSHADLVDTSELESKLNALTQVLSVKREQKAALDSQWIEKRIAFGALSERLERLNQQTIDQEMTRSEYEHNQNLYQTDIQNWTSDISKEEATLVELQQEKEIIVQDVQSRELRLGENKETLNRLRSVVDQNESTRKEVQARRDSASQKVQEFELEHQRLKFEVEELAQLIQERYHVSLEEVLQQVSPEDLEKLLEDETGLGAMEVEARELRQRLEKFGDVNLLALSEFEDIKKRLEFMSAQREDLLKTLDSLQSIIDRINKITEFRFRETFTAINHNFQVLFPKLFGGGRAYMTLTDEANLLETGVEIFAEPPGKRVQAMSLLSGGEKAMTSISLLFALFAYRPASFCILDEVDAPLDEVNTLRYNQIIEEMSALSQFIVITHNKRTMEVADKLFGVTMQEPGVSQLVSVELKEAQALAS
jgi:chromosome segregation protein